MRNFDDVVREIGEFGPYQKRVFVLICIPLLFCASYKMIWVFQGTIPEHRCHLPVDDEISPAMFDLPDDLLNRSIPWDSDENRWSRCYMYKHQVNSSHDPGEIIPCDKWVYDSNTAVAEFDLVCDRSWQRPLAQTFIMIGEFIASIVMSTASDKYGRKRVLMSSLTGLVVVSIALAFSFNFYWFLGLRLLMGIFNPCIFMVGLPYALEFVGPTKRTLVTMSACMFWVVGCLLLSGVSYLVRPWNYLQLTLATPGVFILVLWKFLSESPRWQLTVGKKEQAMKTIREMARVNKAKVVPQLELEGEEKNQNNNETEKKPQVLDLFRYRNIRFRLLVCSYIIFANSFVYYGLGLNSGNMVGGVYLNFFLSSLFEAPATLLCLLVDKLGRKRLIVGPMVIGGVIMTIAVFIPKDAHVVITVLAMVGKFGITMSYTVAYLLVCEIFPTKLRNMGLGFTSIGGRIGGIVAPYSELLGSIWVPGPPLLFGIVSTIGGLVALTLPETTGKDLPESVQDGENFGSNKKSSYLPDIIKNSSQELQTLTPSKERV